MERTLIVLKTDAVQRGLVGEILGRFEKIGLKIVALKMMVASEELVNRHYSDDLIPIIGGKTQKTGTHMASNTPRAKKRSDR